RQRPSEASPKLEEAQEQHGNQRGPDLSLEGVGTGADKGLDLEVLLDGLKEEFHLPSVFVDGGDRRGREPEVIGQEGQLPVPAGIVDLDSAKIGFYAVETDDLILKDVATLENWSMLHDLVDGVVLHPTDEEHGNVPRAVEFRS